MSYLTIERTSVQPPATCGQLPQLLHEFFELQVRENPSRPALECDKEIVTYAQLDRLSNRVAHLLRARGIGPGVLVAIYMKKSCYLFAAMLGVLKAGGAYVPIDPQCPRDRVRNIIIDSRARMLICDDDSEPAELGDSTSVLALTGNEIRRFSRQPLNAAAPAIAPSDACYVIYTSGSTGKPKGVIVEHRNAVNFVRAMQAVYTVRPQDRIYQGFSVAFDASVEEVWAALAFGGTLVVPPDDVGRSPTDAGRFITKQKITFFSTVPTFLTLIEHELPTVRILIVGGEHCASELVERWAPAPVVALRLAPQAMSEFCRSDAQPAKKYFHYADIFRAPS